MQTIKYNVARNLTKDEEINLGTIIQKNLPYFKEVKSKGFNTPEGKMLSEKYKDQIEEYKKARQSLQESNTNLVRNIVHEYSRKIPVTPSYSMDDRVQSGMIGLMKAVDKYDPSRGNKFSTMATAWIYQEVARERNKTGTIIRLPENRISDLVYINNKIEELSEAGLTQHEIMEYIKSERNLTEEDIAVITNAFAPMVSLSGKSGEGDEERDLSEIINVQCDSDLIENIIENKDQKSRFALFFNSLPEKEKDAVGAMFSFPDHEKGGVLTYKKVRSRRRHGFKSANDVESLAIATIDKIKTEMIKRGISIEEAQ